jgi:hypothetical protein
MRFRTPSNDEPDTIFRSSAEEAETKIAEQRWDNEGGRLRSTAAHVTHVAGARLPYTAVLTRPRGLALERSFTTMREAEAFIRRNTPVPAPALSTLYDRPASET